MILSHRKNRGVLTGAGLAAIMALTGVSAVGMLGWKVVKQATNDSSTPEATVQSFVSDLNASKYAEAAALVDGNSVTPEMMKLFAELKSEAKNTPGGFSVTLSDVTSKAEVNRATVFYLIHIKGILYQGTIMEQLTLKLTADGWRITRYETHPPRTLLLASTAFNLSHAIQNACLSNVKAVAISLIMLAADYHDVFKVTAKNWMDKAQPYLKNRTVFTCPLDSKETASYSFNPKLTGLSLAKIARPSETVLVYEGRNGKFNFRHNGKTTVAFVDGHVKQFSPDQAKSLNWNP